MFAAAVRAKELGGLDVHSLRCPSRISYLASLPVLATFTGTTPPLSKITRTPMKSITTMVVCFCWDKGPDFSRTNLRLTDSQVRRPLLPTKVFDAQFCVHTALTCFQRALSMMEPWIENSEPFILVGPEGCGKDMIIRHAFSAAATSRVGGERGGRGDGATAKRVKTSITVLHCNARTTAEHVITKARI